MSTNALIAQGVRPIGADVPQIMGMLGEHRRNALVARREDEVYARQKQEWAREDAARKALAAFDRAGVLENAPELAGQIDQQAMQWGQGALRQLFDARQDPAEFGRRAAAVAQHPMSRWLGITPEQITPENVSALAARIGLAPEQPEQQRLPASYQEYALGQQDPGFAQYMEQRGRPQPTESPANQRLFQWYASLPPEQQQQYLEMVRGAGATPEGAGAIAGARTRATEEAKAEVAAQQDLPRVAANTADMKKVLGQLRQASGLRYIFGISSLVPVVPGTAQADAFALWEQVQGKAFLEAFNTLKGGGQITEKEGEKATAAITRLADRRMSLGAAMVAIRELEDIAEKAEQRARIKAGGRQSSAGSPSPDVADRVKNYYGD